MGNLRRDVQERFKAGGWTRVHSKKGEVWQHPNGAILPNSTRNGGDGGFRRANIMKAIERAEAGQGREPVSAAPPQVVLSWHEWMASVRNRHGMTLKALSMALLPIVLAEGTIRQMEAGRLSPSESEFARWLELFGLDRGTIPVVVPTVPDPEAVAVTPVSAPVAAPLPAEAPPPNAELAPKARSEARPEPQPAPAPLPQAKRPKTPEAVGPTRKLLDLLGAHPGRVFTATAALVEAGLKVDGNTNVLNRLAKAGRVDKVGAGYQHRAHPEAGLAGGESPQPPSLAPLPKAVPVVEAKVAVPPVPAAALAAVRPAEPVPARIAAVPTAVPEDLQRGTERGRSLGAALALLRDPRFTDRDIEELVTRLRARAWTVLVDGLPSI
jgi:hypothetical protein